MTADAVIGVCGAGAMGAGIAQVAARAGHRVFVLDQRQDALERGRGMVAKSVENLKKKGRLDDGEGQALQARISWTLSLEDFADAAFVIEAIVESADAKQALYAALETVVSPDAVIATNTSSLSVTMLASELRAPGRFLGLHFFNPAPAMKLVEVVAGLQTAPEPANAAFELMRRWRKAPAMARDTPGFIVNRVARPFYGEGWRAYEENAATAATIDFIFRDLGGFRMGPLELGDLIGHDINAAVAQSIHEAYFGNTRFRPSLLQSQLVVAGRLGRKSGKGVYDYADGSAAAEARFTPPPDETVDLDAAELDRALAQGGATIDGVTIALTDGRTARRRAQETAGPFATLDWMRGLQYVSALAFAASEPAAAKAAAKLAASLGKRAIQLADRPGLLLFRTLAQLANAAGDAARDHVADVDAIDAAMMNGVNYPLGLADWARRYGHGRLCAALDHIAGETGDRSYSPGEALIARSFEEARP